MFMLSYMWRVHTGDLPTPALFTFGEWLFDHWWVLPVLFAVAATVVIGVRWWKLRDPEPAVEGDSYILDQELPPTPAPMVEPPTQQMWSMPAVDQWDRK
jgi:hypothetical protein